MRLTDSIALVSVTKGSVPSIQDSICRGPMRTEINAARRPGRPREFDRDEALWQAMLLFWKHGYEATPVSALTRTMGINAPALYGAFGDKKQLFLEAVQRYQEAMGRFAQKALTEEPTAE